MLVECLLLFTANMAITHDRWTAQPSSHMLHAQQTSGALGVRQIKVRKHREVIREKMGIEAGKRLMLITA